MNSPCHECICVPICRHKSNFKLITECLLVKNYLTGRRSSGMYIEEYSGRSAEVEKALNPTTWGDNKYEHTML